MGTDGFTSKTLGTPKITVILKAILYKENIFDYKDMLFFINGRSDIKEK